MVVHRGQQMSFPVLTNDTYAASIAYAKNAGHRTGKSSSASLDRFARAASYERGASTPAEAVRRAFALLDDVAQGDHTQWSIGYDMHEKRVFFRTRVARDVRWLDLDGLSFACDTPVKVLDLNAPLSGDVAPKLAPYDYDTNYRLVQTAFAGTPFLRASTEETRAELARYPELTTCTAGHGRRSEK